jgi:hypothetical protein
MSLPAPTVDLGSKEQGSSHTEGVRELLRQRQCLLALLQGLVRVAKHPQDLGETGQAMHHGLWVDEAMGAVLQGLGAGKALLQVEGDTLLQVRAGRAQLSEEAQGIPQRDMSRNEAWGILDPLGQAQHLLGQLPCGLELSTIDIKFRQA